LSKHTKEKQYSETFPTNIFNLKTDLIIFANACPHKFNKYNQGSVSQDIVESGIKPKQPLNQATF
jgi:hypothetical protein